MKTNLYSWCKDNCRDDLIKEWDFKKNEFTPDTIASMSEKQVWWLCDKKHSYKQTIYSRVSKGNGCPYCSGHKVLTGFNDLKTIRPELAKEWHQIKNGSLNPWDVTANSNKKVWWKCSKCGNDWIASVNNRNHLNRGCPYCSHNKAISGVNDLATKYPSLLKEWDYQKNVVDPTTLLPNSNKKAWWICSNNHSFYQGIYERTQKNAKCPYCSNEKVLAGFNDLATTNPELLEEWDYEKNKNINPTMYSKGSGKKVWWLCDNGHSYEADIHNRTAGYGCPYCSNQKVLKGYNDLETTNPDLAKEWDYEKNGELKPSDVIAGSRRKVWWVCKNKHHYKSSIVMRNRGTNCPICNKHKKSSFPEQTIFFYIKKVFPDAVNGYKDKEKFGSRMELDIYIPSINTAIEYDGMIFHNKETLAKDNKKYELCKANKIMLIRIEEIGTASSYFRGCDHKIEINGNKIEHLNYAINNLCYHLGKIVVPNVEKDRKEILHLLDARMVNLKDKYPEIAKEWHYEKNYPLVPENVAPHSTLKVWWKCSKGHSWYSPISYRTYKNSICPECRKLKGNK